MFKEKPTLKSILDNIGVDDKFNKYKIVYAIFERYMYFKRHNKTNINLDLIYYEIGDLFCLSFDRVKKIFYKCYKEAYIKTKFKYLFDYFGLETSSKTPPRTRQTLELIYLILKDNGRTDKSIYLSSMQK